MDNRRSNKFHERNGDLSPEIKRSGPSQKIATNFVEVSQAG